jgi:glucosamine-phosphate N-acetyltransferase
MDVSPEVRVGELTEADLANGFLEALGSLSDVGLSAAEAADVFRERRKAGIHTFVARAPDGRVAGTATLLVEPKFIHRGGRAGHIEDVAVHQDFQKKGIGAALVRHATEEARRLGCYKVLLNCFDRFAPFYERVGYRRHDLGLRHDL